MSMIDDFPQGPTPPEEQRSVPDDVLRQVARDQAGMYDHLVAEGLSDDVIFEELGLRSSEQLAEEYGPDIDDASSTSAITIDQQRLVGRRRYPHVPNDPDAVRRTIEASLQDPDFTPTTPSSSIRTEQHPDAHERAEAARAALKKAAERSRPPTADEKARQDLAQLEERRRTGEATHREEPPIPPTPPQRPTTE